MNNNFIENAITIADRLRTLDARRVVFGSERHAYCFNPPVRLERVEEFERAFNVRLPTPYRSFITNLGDGGAGPFYGIEPLDFDAPQLLESFPHTEAFELPDDDATFELPIPGCITVAEYGCGIYFLLVVRGAAAGQIWVDARYETGISPVTDNHSVPETFDSWWLRWMNTHLEQFEKIRALMKAATAHEEIHRLFDPTVPQLKVDQTMLSIMNRDPSGQPKVLANKPWGAACGLVEEYYADWLDNEQSRNIGGER